MERKLTAILSADVKGYSRLMGADEEATIRTLTAYRAVMTTRIQQQRGRVVDSPGDNLLAEFASVVDAVRCAVEVQRELKVRNAELPDQRKMEFRIGINLGDVVIEGERLYGDGVNIAARLESLAEPGGICISGTVYEHVETKLALSYESLGEQTVKNIAKPVRVWRVVMEESESQKAKGKNQKAKVEHRAGIARRQWAVVTVAGLFLIAGTTVAVRYFPFPLLSPQDSALKTEAAPAALPLPDKPSIVVLPFVNMSGDAEQEYFSDGITEDLTSDLSKISGLFVIARNSAFTYKGKAVKVQDVGKELGVRYVLEGSVRKADNQVRINAQLNDATTGGHVWSERYDRPLKDIFALQDEVVQKIVTALPVEVREAEFKRVQHIPTENLTAYDTFLRGVAYYWRIAPEENAQARQMFERATALDPQFADAYAFIGITYWVDWVQLWNPDPQNLERALEFARRALVVDDSQIGAHSLLSAVYLYKRQHAQAIAEAEQALALGPTMAANLLWMAIIREYTGRPQEAIGFVEQALRLNPLNLMAHLPILGLAYILTGRYEEGIASQQRAIVFHPRHLFVHVNLVVCYIGAGREEEARVAAQEVLRISPKFSLEGFGQRMPFRDPADLERFLAALRKAGLK